METTRDWLAQYPVTALVVSLFLAFLVGVVAYFFARMLLSGVARSADARPPLITAMSLLGILGTIGLIGALFTGQESAYTIAATVVGGLTGYLTAQAQQNKIQGDDGTEQPKPEPEPEPEPSYLDDAPPGDVRNPLPPLLADLPEPRDPGDNDEDNDEDDEPPSTAGV